MVFATSDDVENRLGRSLSEDEMRRVPGLVDEAGLLVESYLRRTFATVPDGVSVVVSRMVARVLDAPTSDAFSAESVSVQAGPFSKSTRFSSGASGGAPWLTATDKMMLRRWSRGGVWSVRLD